MFKDGATERVLFYQIHSGFSPGSDGETGVYIIPNVSQRKWIYNR